jgi:AGCS family alanine or glycine:cation symporter
MNNNKYRIPAFLILIVAVFFSVSVLAAEPSETNKSLNDLFGSVNKFLADIFFFDIIQMVPASASDAKAPGMPFIVAWLVVGAIFLTIRMGFINLRMFRHAYRIIRGKYQVPSAMGEVTSFQALTTALSATVGLGNIAGVAIAVGVGGPGAVFWMIVAGLLGMTSKFTEATLAQMYREVRPDGHVMGGAMEYLSRGLKDKGWSKTGKVLAILFCFLTIGASLGGGNAFQVSQSLSAVQQQIPILVEYSWVYGVVMSFLVGVVIIGGIRRIAHTAQAIVPSMVFIYLIACLWIILGHANEVPRAMGLIVTEAFTLDAGFGGLLGILIVGFKRAAFSSEAGLGSAAIAHAAARVKYPVRQGIVALMEPFIDTVVICTMTALVIILTGVYTDAQYAPLIDANKGAALTSAAFGTVISWFPIILSISVVLFAYSTMISWSYYGERCWTYMFGEKSSMAYRIMFVIFVVIGSVTSATNILEFSDLLILAMAFPNFIGLYMLHGKVKQALSEYLFKLRSGELDREVGRSRE